MSSSFVSVKIIISMFPIIMVFSCSNLLARELIFKVAIINFLGCFILTFFNVVYTLSEFSEFLVIKIWLF